VRVSDPERIPYGPLELQYGLLHRAAGPRRGAIVLIHGGFWRWSPDYLHGPGPLGEALAARGWDVWRPEYRAVGADGGWPATLDDVSAAIDHLGALGLDGGPLVAIGHSGGGHLAAWAATRDHHRVAVTGVVSQAGVLDLERAAELRVHEKVVDEFLDGHPTAVASPIERLPLGVPALLTHGGRDDNVPVEISERFARASGAALIVEPDEDHFGHLDPGNPLWKAVLAWL